MTISDQLAEHMDDVWQRFTRPTSVLDYVVQWGEKAVLRMGPDSVHEVHVACDAWWLSHAPVSKGFSRDAWFELGVAIESLLRAAAEKCVAKPFEGGVTT